MPENPWILRKGVEPIPTSTIATLYMNAKSERLTLSKKFPVLDR